MKAKLLQISAEDYHANKFSPVPCYSNSIGKIIVNKSPKHAWMEHPLLNPAYVPTDKGSFDLGSAAHAALLEGLDVCTVLDFKDWRTDESKQRREEARAAGKIPMLKKDYPDLAEMVNAAQEAIFNCPDLGGLRLTDGQPEQTILVAEDETHIKMRLDWLSDDRDVILDYKTTEIASPEAWMRSISGAGYDMQAGLYTRGVELLTGKEPKFVFMVQEVNPPYAAYFVGLSGQYLHHGQQKTNAAIGIWRNCMRTGIWPSYSSRIMYPDLPSYIEGAWMEKEAMREEETGVSYSKETFLFGKVR